MDSGRFTALVLIVVVLVGATFYYAYSSIQDLQTQVGNLQARSTGWSTSMANTAARADAAKAAADNVAASLAKLGPIDQAVKQAQDAAAAAAKSAQEAENAASGKGRRR
jgi:hypothetical protein